MKKFLAVLVVFLFLFTAQNSFAQEDPFEIGKKIALTGEFDSIEKEWFKEVGYFGVSYFTDQNAEVMFFEYPKSGTGTAVAWIKNLGSNRYFKSTCIIENWQPKGKSKWFSITKEEAEKEAWRILYYFR